MKIIEYFRKRSALRRTRKALMKRISIIEDKIVIEADLIIKGKITGE